MLSLNSYAYMKLEKFKVSNFRRIKKLEIDFKKNNDNILVLAGQNESGKSTILEALESFYQEGFSEDSAFLLKQDNEGKQSTEFIFSVDEKDIEDFCDLLAGTLSADVVFWDSLKEAFKKSTVLKKVKFLVEGTEAGADIDDDDFAKVSGFINAKYQEYLDSQPEENTEDVKEDASTEDENQDTEEDKLINDLVTEEKKSDIVSALYRVAPKFVLFSDSKCDLLPDNIKLSDYVADKGDGKNAVKNLETILNVFFSRIARTETLQRGTIVDEHNKKLSANFSKVFKQKVHNESEVSISYAIDTLSKSRAKDLGKKEDDEDIGEEFIFFSVQTSDGEPLPLRLRSKGLIWFLSFWLVLESMKDQNRVILIDEPDNSLHVNAQSDLLNVLDEIAQTYGHQIIYATHSPFLIPTEKLHRIKLVYNDKKDGVNISEISSGKIDTKSKRDALLPVSHAIGCSVSKHNTIFTDRNIIVEGLSDMFAYQTMGRILKEDEYHYLPGIGTISDKLNPLIGMCIGYGLNWCLVMDSDEKSDEKNSSTKNKYELIKEQVFGGNEEDTKKQVYILEGIKNLEDMFSVDDIEKIASKTGFTLPPQKPKNKDNTSYIGKKNKIIFWKMFASANFKATDFSDTTKSNFKKVFGFIQSALADE
ncbi:MAG: ATP-dependent endonuclease of the OLD family-like protein [Candidatus Magasanikbacteria bacterium GW2011_GWD2_43_18]|uniref:ATP-dependent endonuclease of the OLD family-like protein n=1 Tax=Candidatus Magasanikbacteria bacterium GW2011_GWE2_42_7 TaxID=1619052 RepID=A0A0G1E9Y0_9BACT|nr:MAG: ATP-dependent endonuclease of the OLD family-like protein [Candidatus Magasanikbacteria bacterium GW2011_GWC2_42_27]KKS71413.1 MAG: ATP-dependent endonuclease of the OLD family-like protein [Candidatus Magasanikbacteria bacterium GW2011_GWE2_42_7]KKT04584.1 MAG: ATP-dependent endonuclease of the OLD family-like protein [Candidatus Magasanikbacteria bacterium GW2011_GWD2_43_18]KKT25039.1 MAG: ATP-dependent endonuclease of the OLD family-like protein [Candidatus Magasanikbacteria bacterium